MERKRYLIKFYYIGSEKYFGSQRQLNFQTIEDQIITSLSNKGYIEDVKSSGFEVASRTDRFVTARGSCFSFMSSKIPILMEINSALPLEIGVWAYCEVSNKFLSRFNAKCRHYKYIFPLPLEHKNVMLNNLNLMKIACKKLEGHHDFKNFSKREKKEVNTIRDMYLATLKEQDQFLMFDFKSRAFLRQQVRRMVAKLLDIGMGDLSLEDFDKLLKSDIYTSYQPANPIGLILWDIIYGEKVHFILDKKSYKRMMQFFLNEFNKFNLKQILFKILQHDNIS